MDRHVGSGCFLLWCFLGMFPCAGKLWWVLGATQGRVALTPRACHGAGLHLRMVYVCRKVVGFTGSRPQILSATGAWRTVAWWDRVSQWALGGGGRRGPLHRWESGTCTLPVFGVIMGLNFLRLKAQVSVCSAWRGLGTVAQGRQTMSWSSFCLNTGVKVYWRLAGLCGTHGRWLPGWLVLLRLG